MKTFGIDTLNRLKITPFNECIDSINFVKMLVLLENEFEIEIVNEEHMNMHNYNNINDLYRNINSLLGER
jgi:acyl carrier protein